MLKLNPEILSWARKTSGLELEEAAKKLSLSKLSYKTPANRLKAMESGEEIPSRQLLVKIASKYRRPLLVFYLAQPPKKGDRGKDFRTLPKDYWEANDAMMDAMLRDVHVRQIILKSVLEEDEDVKPLNFVGSVNLNNKPKDVTASIRKTLNLTLTEFRDQKTSGKAFNLLRSKAEAAGIFVLLLKNLGSHHTNISLNTFRGYALADNIAPFVIINKNDSHGAWSFTLIHELAHIWLGETGISGVKFDLEIEKFCNKVAGEFLLPIKELSELVIEESMAFENVTDLITRFAINRNISASMVAYNLYQTGKLDQRQWQKLNNFYREKWIEGRDKERERGRKSKGGPPYYVVKRHNTGIKLVNLVQSYLNEGLLTTTKAGKLLGVKAKKVQDLFEIGN